MDNHPNGREDSMMTSEDAPREQVHDHATDHMSGDEVANAAAETLHGDRAAEEVRPQPDATVLPGGGTLIADDAPGEPDPSRTDR